MSCELKSQIKSIIEKYNNPSESLIAILQEVQALIGYISEESVKCITELTGIASSRVLGVASFYACSGPGEPLLCPSWQCLPCDFQP